MTRVCQSTRPKSLPAIEISSCLFLEKRDEGLCWRHQTLSRPMTKLSRHIRPSQTAVELPTLVHPGAVSQRFLAGLEAEADYGVGSYQRLARLPVLRLLQSPGKPPAPVCML